VAPAGPAFADYQSGARSEALAARGLARRFAGVFAVTLPPAPDSILTRDEVASWLKLKPRQVERLGVPVLDLGPKTKRYMARDVLNWLDTRRQTGLDPRGKT